MSITQNKVRVGNFTSSEFYRLISNGTRAMTEEELAARPKKGEGSRTTLIESPDILSKSALTYIEEKNMERRLGRSIKKDSDAKPLSWGKFLEKLVFSALGTSYEMTSQETDVHPKYPFWVGSKDGINHLATHKAIFDIKCPSEIKSYCTFADCLVNPNPTTEMIEVKGVFVPNTAMNRVRLNHEDGDKYYWQIVSNAAINGLKHGELIVFCPYQHELEVIREAARRAIESEQNDIAWINWAKDENLPYLIPGMYYSNLTVIPFDIPKADLDFAEQKAVLASKKLIEFYQPAF